MSSHSDDDAPPMERPEEPTDDSREMTLEESAEPSTSAPEVVASLRAAIMEELPVLKRVELVDISRPGVDELVFVAAVLPSAEAGDHDVLARWLVACAARYDVTLLPAFYREADWQRLGGRTAEQQWLGCFAPAGDQTSLIAYYQKHREYPASLKRLLGRSLRTYAGLVDSVLSETLRPPHVALGICRDLLGEALGQLFALHGQPFTADAAAIQFFQQEIAKGGQLQQDDILLYFQLAGLAAQAKHCYELTQSERLPFPWKPTIAATQSQLRALARHMGEELTPASERALRRRRRTLQLGLLGALVIAAVVGYHLCTRPERSNADPSQITKPGGIVGSYYSDVKFGTKVHERTDPMINIASGRFRAPGVKLVNFSVRWGGFIAFPKKGKYHLCIESDDGARLFFNRRKLIDDWPHHAARKRCESVRVLKGWYPLKVEYYQLRGQARMRLLRGRDAWNVGVVPPTDLCCRK